MDIPKQSGRNQRRLKNLFLRSAGQVRLLFAFPIGGLVAVMILLISLRNMLDGQLEQLRDSTPGQASTFDHLEGVVNQVLFIAGGICGTAILMLAVFGLLIGHRYYGPQVPILRVLEELRNGTFGGRVRLRAGDELKEVANAVNALAAKLEAEKKA